MQEMSLQCLFHTVRDVLLQAMPLCSSWIENGQVAFQYTTPCGKPSGDVKWNPNGSVCAVEGITSPDGRDLEKWHTPNVWAITYIKCSG